MDSSRSKRRIRRRRLAMIVLLYSVGIRRMKEIIGSPQFGKICAVANSTVNFNAGRRAVYDQNLSPNILLIGWCGEAIENMRDFLQGPLHADFAADDEALDYSSIECHNWRLSICTKGEYLLLDLYNQSRCLDDDDGLVGCSTKYAAVLRKDMELFPVREAAVSSIHLLISRQWKYTWDPIKYSQTITRKTRS